MPTYDPSPELVLTWGGARFVRPDLDWAAKIQAGIELLETANEGIRRSPQRIVRLGRPQLRWHRIVTHPETLEPMCAWECSISIRILRPDFDPPTRITSWRTEDLG